MRHRRLASLRRVGALGIAGLIGLHASRALAIVASCGQDADCDDGLLCDGQEVCSDGFCFLRGGEPCGELSCSEDGATIFCDGRELLATGHVFTAWSEDVALDPALRLGLGVFQPATGRLFDERTYAAADVGSRFTATPDSDADFAAIAARLGDGADDKVGICRDTTVGGLPSQSTCEPTDEHVFFDTVNDRPIGRIDLVLASLVLTPTQTGTSVSVTCDIQLLPESSAVRSQLAALLVLETARRARLRTVAAKQSSI